MKFFLFFILLFYIAAGVCAEEKSYGIWIKKSNKDSLARNVQDQWLWSSVNKLFEGQNLYNSATNSGGLNTWEELKNLSQKFDDFEKDISTLPPIEKTKKRLEFFDIQKKELKTRGLVNELYSEIITPLTNSAATTRSEDYYGVDKILNHFDKVKNENIAPILLKKSEDTFKNTPYLVNAQLVSDLNPEFKQFLGNIFKNQLPTSSEFIKQNAEYFEPIDYTKIHTRVVGNTHFLSDLDIKAPHFQDNFRDYINPTELNPGEAGQILKLAPAGAYLTVGTERGFIGAAQTENASHLVFMDYSYGVNHYNRFNTALLYLAKNREDYLWLRLKATQEEVVARLTKETPDDYRELISNQDSWEIWKKHFNEEGFRLLHEPPDKNYPNHAFESANYLYDDTQFARLSKMAKEGKIASLQIDLSHSSTIEKLVSELKKKNVPLSVFDYSDVWYDIPAHDLVFLKKNQTANLLDSLKPIAKDDSVLLLTSWYATPDSKLAQGKIIMHGKDYRPNLVKVAQSAQSEIKYYPYWDWNYFGFTFDSFKEKGEALELAEKLNQQYLQKGSIDKKFSKTLNGGLPRNSGKRTTISQAFANIAGPSLDCSAWFKKLFK